MALRSIEGGFINRFLTPRLGERKGGYRPPPADAPGLSPIVRPYDLLSQNLKPKLIPPLPASEPRAQTVPQDFQQSAAETVFIRRPTAKGLDDFSKPEKESIQTGHVTERVIQFLERGVNGFAEIELNPGANNVYQGPQHEDQPKQEAVSTPAIHGEEVSDNVVEQLIFELKHGIGGPVDNDLWLPPKPIE